MLPVIWSLPAEVSYVETISFTRELSETLAARLYDEVQEVIQRIAQFNNICPPSPRKPKYRRCTILDGRISLYYMVRKKQIEIIAVRDNRRKPKF
jgi:plasmid stabilization system protein ParE